MKHTINYDEFAIEESKSNFSVKDYNSISTTKIKSYLNSLDSSYYVYLKIDVGAKIEKVLYDYYKNTDYCDLIMLMNNREMIYDMPYSYDIILEAIENDIDRYRSKVFRNNFDKLSDRAYMDLEESLTNKYNNDSTRFLYIKAIRDTMIPVVLSEIRKITNSYQDNINLVNMSN